VAPVFGARPRATAGRLALARFRSGLRSTPQQPVREVASRAIREGVGREGRTLHPQTWYASFRRVADEDYVRDHVCD
jgi:hypothetical protein